MWKTELFGVLQLSEQLPGVSKRLVLCAGIQRTSVNFLGTPLPYRRPWCLIYEHYDATENSDHILKNFSQRPTVSETLGYSATFELQIRYGQVYYLIKIAKMELRSVDEGDVHAEKRFGQRL